MRKRIFWLINALLILIALAACNNNIDDIVEAQIQEAAEPAITAEPASEEVAVSDEASTEPAYSELATAEPASDELQEEISSLRIYEPSDLQFLGVLNWDGYRWTWYSQRVLPGGGLTIPGRHVDEDGYVCDENDYICLASGFLEKGTVVDTPLGKQGCVYDYCATTNTLDVYVDW